MAPKQPPLSKKAQKRALKLARENRLSSVRRGEVKPRTMAEFKTLHEYTKTELEGRITRLTTNSDLQAKIIADKSTTLAQRDAEIRRLDSRIEELQSERDRIVRVVDQFTSIQITGLGVNVQHPTLNHLPKDLRKT